MEDTIESLRAELSEARAQLAEKAALEEINQTLVDLIETLKDGLDKSKAPAINNVVQMPAPCDLQWKHEYDAAGRLVGSTMTRVPMKAKS